MYNGHRYIHAGRSVRRVVLLRAVVGEPVRVEEDDSISSGALTNDEDKCDIIHTGRKHKLAPCMMRCRNDAL